MTESNPKPNYAPEPLDQQVSVAPWPRQLVLERLRDYASLDQAELLRLLVAKWRELHPEAAQEQQPGLRPLELLHRKDPEESPENPDEEWINDTYTVTLRRREDKVFGTRQGMVQLGIHSLDGTARHDWRDFQGIKNQLVGAECEAFELYPAESRLLDPSNYYSLWCFPGLKRIKIGVEDGRRVVDADQAIAPQRAFPDMAANGLP
jgi:hypothetical protein